MFFQLGRLEFFRVPHRWWAIVNLSNNLCCKSSHSFFLLLQQRVILLQVLVLALVLGTLLLLDVISIGLMLLTALLKLIRIGIGVGADLRTHGQKLSSLLLLDKWHDSLSMLMLLLHYICLLILKSLDKGLKLSFLIQSLRVVYKIATILYRTFSWQIVMQSCCNLSVPVEQCIRCWVLCENWRHWWVRLFFNVLIDLKTNLVQFWRNPGLHSIQHCVEIAVLLKSCFVVC